LRLSLTVKLVASILVLVLVPIAGVSMISLEGLNDIRGDVDILYSQNLVVVSEIALGSRALASTESNFILYYGNYDTDLANQYYNEYNTQLSKFAQFVSTFKTNYAYDALPEMVDIITGQDRSDLLTQQASLVEGIEDDWNQYIEYTTDTYTALGHDDLANATLMMASATNTMDDIDSAMDGLIETCVEGAALMDHVAEETITQSVFWTVVGGSSAAIAISIGALLVSMLVTRPIVLVSRAADRISEGDFTTRLEIRPSKDEVGDLVRSMNTLIDNTPTAPGDNSERRGHIRRGFHQGYRRRGEG